MKRILAVALLLMSFASAALTDGSGGPPIPPVKGNATKLAQTGVVLLADGGGEPPIKGATKPPAWKIAA